jgi:hypothetical protein
MTDAPFIVIGWIGTAAIVAAYAVSVLRRIHRAHALAPARERRAR